MILPDTDKKKLSEKTASFLYNMSRPEITIHKKGQTTFVYPFLLKSLGYYLPAAFQASRISSVWFLLSGLSMILTIFPSSSIRKVVRVVPM